MDRSTPLAYSERQLRAALCIPTQTDAPEQYGDPRLLTWPAFLSLLERYCHLRDWDIEYGDVTDCSCAIFAWEDTLPTTFDNKRGEAADETRCLWQQLRLF